MADLDTNSAFEQTDRHEQLDEGWLAHRDRLDGLNDVNWFWQYDEDESMSFGESVTLLIAGGVLIYLIYALVLPERF